MEKIVNINKSETNKLELDGPDPLSSPFSRRMRLDQLKRAVKLNANSSTTVKLILRDRKRGLFKLKSKINMISNKNVALQGGQIIPIKAIESVELV